MTGSILFILLVVLLLFLLPPARKSVAGRLSAALSEKTGTELRVNDLQLGFPRTLLLRGVFCRDLQGDTLLFADRVAADADLGALIGKKIALNKVELSGAVVNLSRIQPDTTFNFDFLAAAFAGNDNNTAVDDSAGSEWKFVVHQIGIDNVRLQYLDQQAGMFLKTTLASANSRIGTFDLDAYTIIADHLELADVRTEVITSASFLPDDTAVAETAPWHFGADVLVLQNVSALYADKTDSSSYSTSVARLRLTGGGIHLGQATISADSLRIQQAVARLFIGISSAPDSVELPVETGEPVDWRMALNSLEMQGSEITLQQRGEKSSQGFDATHMDLSGVMVRAEKMAMHGGEISAQLNDLKLHEARGFDLTHFSGQVRYHPKGVAVEKFSLHTLHSRIGSDIKLFYDSMEALTSSPEKALVHAQLNDCLIGLHDIYYFLPALSRSVSLSPNERLLLSADVNGSLEQLRADLRIQWRNSHLALNGEARDLSKPAAFFLALDTFNVSSGNADMVAVVPADVLPSGISLPEKIALEGNFFGFLKNFNSDVRLQSSVGSLAANITMDPAAGNTIVRYSGQIHTNELQLGPVFRQKDLGPLTFSIGFSGSGFDTATINTQLQMHLVSLLYRNYDYRDLTLRGKITGSSFEGNAIMRDDNLSFDFNGMFDLDKSLPRFVFRLDLKGMDLRALNLSEDDNRVSGRVHADIDLPKGQNPLGMAGVYDITVVRENKRHLVDSLVFISRKENGEDIVLLASDKLEGEARGSFLFPELGRAVMNYVNGHFDLDPEKRDSTTGANSITASLRLKDPAFLTSGLVPGLTRLHPMEMKASFTSQPPRLAANLFLPGAVYNNIRIDSLRLFVKGDEGSIRSAITAAQVSDTVKFRFENLSLLAGARHDSLNFGVRVSRDDSTTVFFAEGTVLGGDSAFTLRMKPAMVMGGAEWKMDSLNVVRFGPRPVRIDQFFLSDGKQEVKLFHGSGDLPALHAVFRNFEIASVTSVMQHSVPLVAGVINGSLVIDRQNRNTAFRSDISVDGLKYKDAAIGDVVLKADNYSDPDAYDVQLNVTGQGNDIVVDGTYYPAREKRNLDLALKIRSLQLKAAEPFTGGEVSAMSGWIAGDLKMSGDVNNPRIEGALLTHEIGFRPKIIDSHLRIPGGELTFNGQEIRLDQLNVFDSLGNRAIVSGVVDIGNISEPAFDLRLQTKNFLAMNTDKTDNGLYFGRIFLDSDVRLTGSPAKPTIEAKAKLNKGSSITYIKPEDQLLKDESRGIVEFTDSLGAHAGIVTRTDSAAVHGIAGLQLNAEINVDKDFDLKVIVDPLAGDSLYIRGGGRLHFSMERSGSTALSGKYDITKGGYYLTINNIVKRDFRIAEGSSVTWSGDPLDAYVDLNAVYRVKASPYDLVQDQLAGMGELEANKYRNLLTFDVYLQMMGFISSPQISFDIRLAQQDRGAHGSAISTRLAQIREDENQLNKQVFALLTLRRFIGENPLESGSGGGLASAGRSSASKVLTQQLNTLSDKYVEFVDLDLGVNSYEDYSTGTEQGRTQVQVGVSKQLFNERITVRVGGNVDVEGPYAAQNDVNDVAGNLGIDYKLTEDGRYRLKAFRENQYENPIEGEITRTGAGFVFSRDFNRFRNLFRKPRQRENEQTTKK